MRLVLGLALCLAALAGPVAAQAAQRYAAPGANGVGCTQGEPCSLEDAINGASANDEVIVTAGSYTVTGAPINVVYEGLQIHGDLGGPMPRVVAHLGGLPAIRITAPGAGLTYLEIMNEETEGVGVDCLSQGTVERISALGVGEGAAGLRAFSGCLVRDSLVRGQGTSSLGLESLAIAAGEPESVVRNVTAVATGENSVGIQSRYNGPEGGHHTLVLSSSIASGGTFDLRAEESAGRGVIEVSNSNFDTVSAEGAASISGPANQSAPPLFLDAAAGNYREAPGSPTIDAGSSEGIGQLDLEGNARLQGPAPDIGAFESAPVPVAGTLTALSVSPKAFRPLKGRSPIGRGPIASATKGKRPKAKAGATVRYSLTAPASVTFTVERALKGRRVGRKCAKQTAANREKKSCTRYKELKGSFDHQGSAGANSFRYSGWYRNTRLTPRNKALAPGKYRLAGRAGASVKRTTFTITR